MKEKIQNLSYKILLPDQEKPDWVSKLLTEAENALTISYSPYSQFAVGAALITENNIIIKGGNIENASYPLCMCAERVALYAYNSQEISSPIKAMAITARNKKNNINKPIPPCGACRQVIAEYEQRQNESIRIYLKNSQNEIFQFDGIDNLLPLSFDHKFLL